MKYDIAIVGGGPAGYFSAIKLLEKDPSLQILLLEKGEKSLKKLLLSGSGACNFTHSGSIDDFLQKYGSNGRFLRNAFYEYFNDDFVDFLESNGVQTHCRDDGKYFPKSMKVIDIKNLFLEKTRAVTTKLSCEVTYIETDGEDFTIKTIQNKDFTAKKILITTGGKSVPSTGSTGDGYSFAQHFGHTIITPKQSLASVYSKNFELSECSGISFENALVKKDKKLFKGSLLITHKGLSGPVIIDNSRNFYVNDTVFVSFIPETIENFEKKLRDNQNETLFQGIKQYSIPKKLLQYFCDSLNINLAKKIAEISSKKIRQLAEKLIAYPFNITGIEGFESCMCTAGGVSIKEVNPKTFESKLCPNLYFLGEVLDIDGDSGGYNLQAIWSSASLFAKNF